MTSEGEKYARTVKVPGDGVPGQLELGLLGSLTAHWKCAFEYGHHNSSRKVEAVSGVSKTAWVFVHSLCIGHDHRNRHRRLQRIQACELAKSERHHYEANCSTFHEWPT